ncbi:MAG: hypothetical protein RBJ76_13395 [Stenomitos frigidus ULC029]
MNTTYFQRTRASVETCPLREDGGSCGKPVYAKGVCKRCSRAEERWFSDQAYDSSERGRERRADYELSEKGQAKKRRYARKLAIAKRVILYLRADVPLDQRNLLDEIRNRFEVGEHEAQEILTAAIAYAQKHPEL